MLIPRGLPRPRSDRGVPPLAGFSPKDEILAATFHTDTGACGRVVVGAFMTAFSRSACVLAFFGGRGCPTRSPFTCKSPPAV